MDVELIAQPYVNSANVAMHIINACADPRIKNIDIVVAWAKRTGFRQIEKSLFDFRARGGHLRIITGISQKGATLQGLQKCLKLADESYVVNVDGRTFHPKIYRFKSFSQNEIIIGSSNLTAGGLVANFEVSTRISAAFDKQKKLPHIFNQIDDYITALVEDNDVCVPLTDNVITALFNTNVIYDENKSLSDFDESNSLPEGKKLSLFGNSQYSFRYAMGNSLRQTEDVGLGGLRGSIEDNDSELIPNSEKNQLVDNQPLMRYAKILSRADVSRLEPKSHPQGHATLVMGLNKIQPANYFRQKFFNEAKWQVVNASKFTEVLIEEHAKVIFEVYEDSTFFGQHELLIVHKPKFNSGQNNRVIMLRWGGYLSSYLRNTVNHSGHYLVLEKYPKGKYVLKFVINENRVGDLI